jgi:hypothetical protein
MSVRTVDLRILREGPTHNHLLSPLTPYLAVVGPYEAVTIRVPYEHRRLLRDLNALRYGATASRLPDVTRITAPDRRIIADDVSEIFAAVPGLTSEMATEAACHPRLTHLRLIFSASELSLLPFELSTAPRGFPGEGSPLSIQTVAPVVITRSIPGATGRRCTWGGPPRILFVAAQPPGFSAIPFKPHLLALLKALRPWTGVLVDDLGSKNSPDKLLAPYLTVLPHASLDEIETACRSECYTHVHILAHSQEIEDGGQSQFALALHDRAGGKALVSADRLQAALRLPLTRAREDVHFSHPLVVSLATCDSGQQTQVVFPAVSLAHALHAAGVPLVVGSLFPLSHRGSVVMADTLYTGLLRGRDPRRVLHDVRHDMFRLEDHTHDWASLVAYASFPDDLDQQVDNLAYEACTAAIKAGTGRREKLLGAYRKDSGGAERLAERLAALDEDIERASQDMPVTGPFAVEGQGMLASKDKQRAEMFFEAAKRLNTGSQEAKDLLAKSRRALEGARNLYQKAAKTPRWTIARPKAELPTIHWVLTQALSLRFVLDWMLDWQTWWAAKVDADNYLNGNAETPGGAVSDGDVIWAHGSIAELYLLAHGALAAETPDPTFAATLEGVKPAEEARRHVSALAQLGRARGEAMFADSTRKQLKRYVDWWLSDAFAGDKAQDKVALALRDLAQELLKIVEAPH